MKYNSRQTGKNRYKKFKLENTNFDPSFGRIIKSRLVFNTARL